MAKTPIFTGSCTAIVTPFTDTGVDYAKYAELIDFQYAGGTSAILVCGTTGENPTHTEEEHNKLVELTVEKCAGRMKVIAGVGSYNTEHALEQARQAEAAGADGILMVTPYYNKSTQKGLIEHFTYVADRVNVPMILYNVPGRTAAETVKTLGVGIDHEGGGLFVMERAQPAQRPPTAAQLHILADDLLDVVAAHHFLYVFLRDHGPFHLLVL